MPARTSIQKVKLTQLAGNDVKEASLPSSESAASFLRGEPGGFGKFVASTLLRSVLIAPGIVLGGVREPKQILLGSIASSVMISGFIVLYLATKDDQPKHKLIKTSRRTTRKR